MHGKFSRSVFGHQCWRMRTASSHVRVLGECGSEARAHMLQLVVPFRLWSLHPFPDFLVALDEKHQRAVPGNPFAGSCSFLKAQEPA